jgi:hypothetical protein
MTARPSKIVGKAGAAHDDADGTKVLAANRAELERIRKGS